MRNTLRKFLRLSRPLHSVSVVTKQAPLALSNAKVSCKYGLWLVARINKKNRLIVKGAEFEKAFPLSRDLEQGDVQNVMNQMRNSSYNKSVVRQNYIAASQKDRQQIAEAVKKTEKGDDS